MTSSPALTRFRKPLDVPFQSLSSTTCKLSTARQRLSVVEMGDAFIPLAAASMLSLLIDSYRAPFRLVIPSPSAVALYLQLVQQTCFFMNVDR